MKAVTITKKVVDGLFKWNTDGFLPSDDYDRRFIKALIIACIGRKNVMENKMDEVALEFVKGKFAGFKPRLDIYLTTIYILLTKDLFKKRLTKGSRLEAVSVDILVATCIRQIQSGNLL